MSDLPFTAILRFGRFEFAMAARQLPLQVKLPVPDPVSKMVADAELPEGKVVEQQQYMIFRMQTPPRDNRAVYYFDGFTS